MTDEQTGRQTTESPSRRPPRWLGVLAGVGLVLALAAVARWQRSGAGLTVRADPNAPDPEVPRMTVATAKRLLDSGQAVLIDVRGEPYYSQLHAQGAETLPSGDVDRWIGQLPKDKWLILYCT